ncbi:MAG TPA: hypothetical protein VLJ60_02120 [bacterium]|nr:hypothetical protein [bacterium]
MRKLLVFMILLFLAGCNSGNGTAVNDNAGINSDDFTEPDKDSSNDQKDFPDDDEFMDYSEEENDSYENDENMILDSVDETPDTDPIIHTLYCTDIWQCMSGCEDPGVCDECTDNADPQALIDYYNLRNCIDDNCSEKSGEELSECVNDVCYCELYFCAGSNSCDCSPGVPYGNVSVESDFSYAVIDEDDIINGYINEPVVTGAIGNDSVENFRFSNGVESYLFYTEDSGYPEEPLFILWQRTIFDESIEPEDGLLNVGIIFFEQTQTGENSVGMLVDDTVQLIVFGEDDCIYALGIGKINVESIVIDKGDKGRLKANASEIFIYSPYNIPQYGGDISDSGLKVCPVLDPYWRESQCERK